MVRVWLLVAVALVGCAGGAEFGEPSVSEVPGSGAAATGAPGDGSLDDEATGDEAPAPQAEPGDAVTVQGFRFTPAALAVEPGTTVTWTNEDGVGHTVTAGTPQAPGDAFDLRVDARGDTAVHAFAAAGRYPYFCAVHPAMRGEVVVG